MTLGLVFSPAGDTSSLALRLRALGERTQNESGRPVVFSETTESQGPFPDHPCLSVIHGEHATFHYMALPEGPEAAPFHELLTVLEDGTDAVFAKGSLDSAELLVFVARTCPFCPQAVRAAHGVALAHQGISVTVLDAFELPGIAQRFGVRSVPLTVLDRGLSWTGVLTATEIEESLRTRGGEEHFQRLLRSLTEAGRFDDAAMKLMDLPGRSAFAALWRDSTLETRLGLLLTAQNALEADPRLLDPLVPGLLPTLTTDDPARRGDTVDLLGQIGHPSAREALERLVCDPHPDVAEAAGEALERVRKKSSIRVG